MTTLELEGVGRRGMQTLKRIDAAIDSGEWAGFKVRGLMAWSIDGRQRQEGCRSDWGTPRSRDCPGLGLLAAKKRVINGEGTRRCPESENTVRIVLDTNILVSACWKPGGLEAQVVNMATTGEAIACVSPAVLAEYRDVLSRPKLAAVNARTIELLAALELNAIVVERAIPVNTSIDDDDNRFLECASAAGAEFLITGNLRHYPATCGTTRVVNARAFLSYYPAKVVL